MSFIQTAIINLGNFNFILDSENNLNHERYLTDCAKISTDLFVVHSSV